jgi:hypothetical protein
MESDYAEIYDFATILRAILAEYLHLSKEYPQGQDYPY